MKLKKIDNNVHELELSSGVRIYFSYETPVVIKTQGNTFQTHNWYSKTTSKHIRKILALYGMTQEDSYHVSQKELESIILDFKT